MVANGQRITFERFLTSPNQWDLFVANADGTAVTNVTQTPTDDEHSPAFSPDGTSWSSGSPSTASR